MKTLVVRFAGRVQGVGFRRFVQRHAVLLDVKGWVQNLPDGSVEASFQGNVPAISTLIDTCKRGPFGSDVRDVSISEGSEKTTFTGFEIRA